MMRTLFELCKIDHKTWRAFPKGDHNSTVSEPGYFEAIWDFLTQEVLQADERRKGNDANRVPSLEAVGKALGCALLSLRLFDKLDDLRQGTFLVQAIDPHPNRTIAVDRPREAAITV